MYVPGSDSSGSSALPIIDKKYPYILIVLVFKLPFIPVLTNLLHYLFVPVKILPMTGQLWTLVIYNL